MYKLEFEDGQTLSLQGYNLGQMKHRARMENAILFSPVSEVLYAPDWL